MENINFKDYIALKEITNTCGTDRGTMKFVARSANVDTLSIARYRELKKRTDKPEHILFFNKDEILKAIKDFEQTIRQVSPKMFTSEKFYKRFKWDIHQYEKVKSIKISKESV